MAASSTKTLRQVNLILNSYTVFSVRVTSLFQPINECLVSIDLNTFQNEAVQKKVFYPYEQWLCLHRRMYKPTTINFRYSEIEGKK